VAELLAKSPHSAGEELKDVVGMTQFRGCAASLKHGEGVFSGARPEKYIPKTFLDFPH